MALHLNYHSHNSISGRDHSSEASPLHLERLLAKTSLRLLCERFDAFRHACCEIDDQILNKFKLYLMHKQSIKLFLLKKIYFLLLNIRTSLKNLTEFNLLKKVEKKYLEWNRRVNNTTVVISQVS